MAATICTTSALGTIKEIKTIDEARAYVFEKPRTLVFFDVDNTLLEPKNGPIGSTQWVNALMNHAIANGLDLRWEHMCRSGLNLCRQIELTCIEDTAVKLVSNLQDQRIPALVLTARSPDWWQDTVRELTHAGFNFSRSIFGQQYLYFDLPQGRSLLAHGMLLAGPNSKASVLERFLEIADYCPERIVCIDDNEDVLTELEALFASKPDIEFIGLRYGFLDEKVRAFKLDESTIPPEFMDFVERVAQRQKIDY